MPHLQDLLQCPYRGHILPRIFEPMADQVMSFRVRPFLSIQSSSNRQSLPSGSTSAWPGTSQSCTAVCGSSYSIFFHSLVLLRGVSSLHHGLKLFLPASLYSVIILHKWSSLKFSCISNPVLDTAFQRTQNDSVSTGCDSRELIIK